MSQLLPKKKRYQRAIKLINFVPLKVKYVGINFFSVLYYVVALYFLSKSIYPKKKELNFEHYLVE